MMPSGAISISGILPILFWRLYFGGWGFRALALCDTSYETWENWPAGRRWILEICRLDKTPCPRVRLMASNAKSNLHIRALQISPRPQVRRHTLAQRSKAASHNLRPRAKYWFHHRPVVRVRSPRPIRFEGWQPSLVDFSDLWSESQVASRFAVEFYAR